METTPQVQQKFGGGRTASNACLWTPQKPDTAVAQGHGSSPVMDEPSPPRAAGAAQEAHIAEQERPTTAPQLSAHNVGAAMASLEQRAMLVELQLENERAATVQARAQLKQEQQAALTASAQRIQLESKMAARWEGLQEQQLMVERKLQGELEDLHRGKRATEAMTPWEKESMDGAAQAQLLLLSEQDDDRPCLQERPATAGRSGQRQQRRPVPAAPSKSKKVSKAKKSPLLTQPDDMQERQQLMSMLREQRRKLEDMTDIDLIGEDSVEQLRAVLSESDARADAAVVPVVVCSPSDGVESERTAELEPCLEQQRRRLDEYFQEQDEFVQHGSGEEVAEEAEETAEEEAEELEPEPPGGEYIISLLAYEGPYLQDVTEAEEEDDDGGSVSVSEEVEEAPSVRSGVDSCEDDVLVEAEEEREIQEWSGEVEVLQQRLRAQQQVLQLERARQQRCNKAPQPVIGTRVRRPRSADSSSSSVGRVPQPTRPKSVKARACAAEKKNEKNKKLLRPAPRTTSLGQGEGGSIALPTAPNGGALEAFITTEDGWACR